ncbi:MAG: hypothetical protein J07HX64_00010 [halophilic archaeon J07HX64]|nr:MAG: hypothetical protein J07HX64_00010 [halophilic archaeon J07HX64]
MYARHVTVVRRDREFVEAPVVGDTLGSYGDILVRAGQHVRGADELRSDRITALVGRTHIDGKCRFVRGAAEQVRRVERRQCVV